MAFDIQKSSGSAEVTIAGESIDLDIEGGVAHDAADSGNPIKNGSRARGSQIAAVAEDDRADAISNLHGEQVNAGFTWGTESNRGEEIDPISSHHVEETLADVTNETDATNYYYLDMDGYRNFGLQVNTGGTAPTSTVTITVEASLQDDGTAAASCFYEDVTNTLFGVASWVDTDFTGFADTPIAVKYIRVKTVTAGGGNDQDYTVYAKRQY